MAAGAPNLPRPERVGFNCTAVVRENWWVDYQVTSCADGRWRQRQCEPSAQVRRVNKRCGSRPEVARPPHARASGRCPRSPSRQAGLSALANGVAMRWERVGEMAQSAEAVCFRTRLLSPRNSTRSSSGKSRETSQKLHRHRVGQVLCGEQTEKTFAWGPAGQDTSTPEESGCQRGGSPASAHGGRGLLEMRQRGCRGKPCCPCG